ncbi:MAG: hypothetical protein ACTSYB_16580 [Candidatus Helarchaeota archaeon]
MGDDQFSKILAKMQKERIVRIRQILFELYATEQNKSRISKILRISPQTVGPDLDLLERYSLIVRTREEHTKGIPSIFYKTNIDSMVNSLNLSYEDTQLLMQLIDKFQPIYSEIKGYQRELLKEANTEAFEEIYSTIIPLNRKMLILQFIISILLWNAVFFYKYIPFFSKLEENKLPIENYKLYIARMKVLMKYKEDGATINWLMENSESIGQLYDKIWNEFYKDFFFSSVLREPMMKVIRSLDIIKEYEIREIIEKLKIQRVFFPSDFKKSNELKRQEMNVKQKIQELLNNANIIIQKGMKFFLKEKELLNKLDNLRSRISLLKNQIGRIGIGEGALEILKVKSQVMNVILVQANMLSNLCVKLEENFDNRSAVLVLIPEINSIISDLNVLLNFAQEISPHIKNAEKIKEQLQSQFQLILKEFRTPIKKKDLSKKEYQRIIEEKLLEIGEILKEETGGIITIPELYQKFKKRYPEIELELDDLRKNINKLIDKRLIPRIKKLKSGVEVLRFYPSEFSADQTAIVDLVYKRGKVTVAFLMKTLNWSQERIRQVLEDLEHSKILYRTSSASEGEVWYLKGVNM